MTLIRLSNPPTNEELGFLEDSITSAFQNAGILEEYNQTTADNILDTAKRAQGILPVPRQESRFYKYKRSSDTVHIVAESPDDYNRALIRAARKYDFPEAECLIVWRHECKHFSKAIELGFPEPFMFYCFNLMASGLYVISPSTGLGIIPDTMTDEYFRSAVIQVVQAVDDPSWGDKLFDSQVSVRL